MTGETSDRTGNHESGRAARVRRVVAVVAILAGTALIVETIALSLFADARGGERVTDRFRPVVSSPGLATLHNDFGHVKAMEMQFFGQTMPAVGRDLKLSPAQLDALVKRRYPAVAAARTEIPPAVAFVTPAVPKIEGVHDDFKAIDSLPAFGLPLDATPWILVGAGALLIGLGLIALRRPSAGKTSLLLVAGAALVVVPLALSIPHKAHAAEHVDKVGRLTLSSTAATTAYKTMQVTEALIDEVETKLVPDLAKQLHQDPHALLAAIAKQYPAVAVGLQDWPHHLKPAGYALARAQLASVDDFKQLDDLPFNALPWLVMGPGIALLLAAGAGLAAGRRRTGSA
jgi:hypothetical protein